MVTVITVCLNEVARIRRTAESVAKQTCRDYEWVVIDGGSTDGTLDVLDEYRENITIYISEPDGGIYYGMNKGIRHARGEFCLFMNGGDEFHDINVLDRFMAYKPKKDINYGGNVEIHHDGKAVTKFLEPINDWIEHLYYRSLPHQATFIRSELFQRFGKYDVRFRIMADMEFFARAIVTNKSSVAHLPWRVAIYNYDGLSAQSKGSNCLRKEMMKYRRMRFGWRLIAHNWFNSLIKNVLMTRP